MAHPLEARTKNQDVELDGKSAELPSHLLKMEHREISDSGGKQNAKHTVKKYVFFELMKTKSTKLFLKLNFSPFFARYLSLG